MKHSSYVLHRIRSTALETVRVLDPARVPSDTHDGGGPPAEQRRNAPPLKNRCIRVGTRFRYDPVDTRQSP